MIHVALNFVYINGGEGFNGNVDADRAPNQLTFEIGAANSLFGGSDFVGGFCFGGTVKHTSQLCGQVSDVGFFCHEISIQRFYVKQQLFLGLLSLNFWQPQYGLSAPGLPFHSVGAE
jgi:hypothetical protein